jgi:choline kinase
MKAIILAAGEGKRLRPLTDDIPKCMVPLAGRTVLDWQIETMRRCGIDDIVVVKGYKAEKITRTDVRYYVNERHAVTNMVISLWCASEELCGDIIVSYGDILYNDDILRRVMASGDDISVVVDTDWEEYWKMRFDDPLKDAEALNISEDGRIHVIGQKAHMLSDVHAGYVGLIRFNANGICSFKKSFMNAKNVSAAGGKPWGMPRQFDNAFITDMLQGLIHEGQCVMALKIAGGWIEIDSLDDIRVAERCFNDGTISRTRSEAR